MICKARRGKQYSNLSVLHVYKEVKAPCKQNINVLSQNFRSVIFSASCTYGFVAALLAISAVLLFYILFPVVKSS